MTRKKNRIDKIYLVPHTHYDAIWIFTKEDYFYINIDLILKKVVDLLEKQKDYKFLIEQTYLLSVVERRYPKLFKKIANYIKKGRVEIVDGEYLMADTMLPQEETLIREILFGKKHVRKKFRVNVSVMWQADSFGLNAQLPQIYRKSGYKYLAFRRGCPEKKPSEFMWQGLDGTKILSHWMPLGYRAGLNLKKLDQNYKELKKLAATEHILMPCGSGVTMPQEDTTEVVKDWNNSHNTKMKIATPIEFFKNLEKSARKLPVRKGEMYSGRYSEVFPDCCSSRIWIKNSLRKCENKLLSLEKFSTINSLVNTYYPEELGDCWRKILFLAFHDVVPGTSIDTGYEEVKQHIGFLDSQLRILTPHLLRSIVENDSNQEERGDIIVFNPLSWEVSNWVELDLGFEQGKIKKIEGLKCGDEEIEVEIINFSRYEDESLRTARIGFVPKVPATGYKIYKILERKPKPSSGLLRIIGNRIENKFFKTEFSPVNGLIEILKDGKKICKGNELVIEEETGDLYYHKHNLEKPLKTEGGEGVKYGFFKIRNFRIDKSPLRRVINIDTDYYSLRWPYRLLDKLDPILWKHNFISFNKKIIVYKDIPRIDFITIVKNQHPRIRLRVKFSTPLKNSLYTCETQFGAINRKTNQYYYNPKNWVEAPRGIYPSLRWIDYSDWERGITLINKGIPENEVRDGNLYLTLLRSVSVLSSDGTCGPAVPVSDARELKELKFEYSLYPHDGDWKKAKSYQQGYEFNYDLVALQLPKGKYRIKRSFFEIKPNNVILTTIKRSEKNTGIIIRFYETEGKRTKTIINLFKSPKKVEVVNLIEEKDKEFDKKLKVENKTISLDMNPFEIVTLNLEL